MQRAMTWVVTMLTTFAACAAFAQTTSPSPAATQPAGQKLYTILPMGDSITHGNGGFSVYRFPLWEKLHAAGYLAEYVGSRESDTRIGPIKHEGYGGHTAEFLAANIERLYKANPADIVLLHSGHNHTVEEKPIPGILAATEKIVTTVLRLNPDARILVAQVIPSGKLPKYSYIPELNEELAKLVVRLDAGRSRVFIVNQAEGFDVNSDTVGDKVHPNASGAEKMASKWFEKLVTILPPPPAIEQARPQLITYKKGKGYELKLHVFGAAPGGAGKPAIVYFFGGGWSNGTPLQFYSDCKWLASLGMVAIAADYRISSVNKTTPFECVADAKSAIRYVRQHAGELGVDPDRIAASGASAGGHLAAATAMSHGFDEPGEDLSISARPNALILQYPVVDNSPSGFGDAAVKDRYKDFSPLYAVDQKAPPTIIFQGTRDAFTPVATIQAFQKRLIELGGECELKLFEGAGHPIYAYRQPPTPLRDVVRADTRAFLERLSYLKPEHPQP